LLLADRFKGAVRFVQIAVAAVGGRATIKKPIVGVNSSQPSGKESLVDRFLDLVDGGATVPPR
jgi:hypothetical protein